MAALLLVSVPLWPFLLAIPAIRNRVPKPHFFALLPAILVVALLPTQYLDLPWLLFGSGLGLDSISRLFLGVSVLVWVAVTVVFSRRTTKDSGKGARIPSFFWLAMSGNFGAILATDLIGFFAFSTLMGFGFYGLMVSDQYGELKKSVHRAGLIYLVPMIIADVVLLEVLLITALVTDNLSFSSVYQSIPESDSLGLYVWLVVLGFILKAGIWPLHFWLVGVFRRAGSSAAILLCGIPVMMAFLGMVRWLPLGEVVMPDTGLIIQGIGVVALLYAGFFLLSQRLKKQPLGLSSVYFVLLLSGVFILAIGSALADAAVWTQYENGFYFMVVLMALGTTLLLLSGTRTQAADHPPALGDLEGHKSMWFERWSQVSVSRVGGFCVGTLPKWRTGAEVKIQSLRPVISRWANLLEAKEHALRCWLLAVALFLVLVVVIGVIMAFNGTAGLS